MRPLLATLALASALSAQDPSDGRIVLAVQDGAGEAISGALIVLEGWTRDGNLRQIIRHGVSDAGGVLRFANLPNGNYFARPSVAGRLNAPDGWHSFSLDGPKAVVSSPLILVRRPVLTGVVLDQRGRPAIGARVHLLRRSFSDGETAVNEAGSGQADDRGVFRIAVDAPGRYWVKAHAMEQAFPRGSAPTPTGVAFYPGSPDLLGAQRVDLEWDRPEVEIGLTLPRAPRTKLIVAMVSGPAGQPCYNCIYSLFRVEGPHHYYIAGGKSPGRPDLDYGGIPPGEYRIYLQDRDRHPGWWAIAETAVAEGGATELLVATRPPVPVAGKVILEDPPAEALQSIGDAEEAVAVQLRWVGRVPLSGAPGSVDQLRVPLDQPHFSLGPTTGRTFELAIYVHGTPSYIAGIRRQGRPLETKVLNLAEPGGWSDLEVTVRFDPGSVTFELAQDPGGPGARIALIPDESHPFGEMREMFVPSGDRIGFGPLSPGRYWAFAAAGAGPPIGPELADPENRRHWTAWGKRVDVQPGENPTIELKPVNLEQR
jgi:hypothetical protein